MIFLFHIAPLRVGRNFDLQGDVSRALAHVCTTCILAMDMRMAVGIGGDR